MAMAKGRSGAKRSGEVQRGVQRGAKERREEREGKSGKRWGRKKEEWTAGSEGFMGVQGRCFGAFAHSPQPIHIALAPHPQARPGWPSPHPRAMDGVCLLPLYPHSSIVVAGLCLFGHVQQRIVLSLHFTSILLSLSPATRTVRGCRSAQLWRSPPLMFVVQPSFHCCRIRMQGCIQKSNVRTLNTKQIS